MKRGGGRGCSRQEVMRGETFVLPRDEWSSLSAPPCFKSRDQSSSSLFCQFFIKEKQWRAVSGFHLILSS
ncbi:hypothetical protein CHARACLAT_000488 [Characodon lateralis]|uniref:Uncharacterized protein n=1 Tax=Characodon lateralis TaxID=208331 RepID=A0ABU7EZ45_9TELE|nr:hypothetical protein [Characodon lateralis]